MSGKSIFACINTAVALGQVSPEAAEEAKTLVTGLQLKFGETMSPASAEAAAALEAAKMLRENARNRKVELLADLDARQAIDERMAQHPKGGTAGAFGVLTRDVYDKGKVNVESLGKAYFERGMARFGEALEAMQSKLAGLKQDLDVPLRIVDELFGKDTGDPLAKRAAAVWSSINADGRRDLEANGRFVAWRDDWRLPQFWSSRRVEKFKKVFDGELLALARRGEVELIDPNTHRPVDPGMWAQFIEGVREHIITDMTYAARRAFNPAERAIVFKTPEAWKAMMLKYGPGEGGIRDMFVGHLDGLAREYAFTRVMGPNYPAAFRGMFERAVRDWKDGNKSGLLIRPWASPAGLERTYKVMSGSLDGGLQSDMIGGFFGAGRSMLTASALNSSLISSIPGDSVTTWLAARFNGIPGLSTIAEGFKNMAGTQAGKKLAARVNVSAHAVIDAAIGSRQYKDEAVHFETANKLASFTQRLFGQDAWTLGLKRAFATEFLGFIADQAAHDIGAVKPEFRRFLERYGFDAAEWDRVRATTQIEHMGATFFDPWSIEDRDLRDKMLSAFEDERQFAVIEPTARIRQVTTAGLKRGTFMGEVARSGSLFRSFSMTFLMTHLMRAANQIRDNGLTGVGYGAGLITMLTIAGAISLQVRQLINGKTPRDMSTPGFWGAAMATGGVGSIYGDYFAQTINSRTGLDLGATLIGGPVMGLANDIGNLIVKPGKQEIEGDKITLGRQLAEFVRRYTPGSTGWYSRLITDRLVFDQFQQLVDPNYRQSFRRQIDNARKFYGQTYWWRPGATAPQL